MAWVSDLVLFLFLAALPVLLWSWPKTRRMTGEWITAGKTVPLGCLVTIFLPATLGVVIRAAFGWFEKDWSSRPAHLMLMLSVVGLVGGIGLIVYLAKFIWRRWGAVGKRSMYPFLVGFVFFGIAGYLLAMGVMFFCYAQFGRFSDWSTRELPGDLAFEERPIHPFLAEYEYRIRFGRGKAAEYRNLHINCGGRTEVNVYRLRDGRLFFADKDAEFIVDPAKREVLSVGKESGTVYGTPYFRDDLSKKGGSFPLVMPRSDKSVELPKELLERKVYLGTITTRFRPAT